MSGQASTTSPAVPSSSKAVTVRPQGSSSSNADARREDEVAIGQAPRRFERAITWTRVAGAVAALLIAPLLPNLGLPYVLARPDSTCSPADLEQTSKVAFVG